ncbi:hypothetical protein VNO78_05827 [Psophocarpus tetragonolobus]|uniref:Uncharacterized protein n=1 Tax=Psophocarpus tetragonolobus TaxID=3891 RepID=A0AAN9SSX2_PSOTE
MNLAITHSKMRSSCYPLDHPFVSSQPLKSQNRVPAVSYSTPKLHLTPLDGRRTTCICMYNGLASGSCSCTPPFLVAGTDQIVLQLQSKFHSLTLPGLLNINQSTQLTYMASAYVCGERGGLTVEDPCQLRVSLNGVRGLDIEVEKKVVEEKLNQLQQDGATEEDIIKWP